MGCVARQYFSERRALGVIQTLAEGSYLLLFLLPASYRKLHTIIFRVCLVCRVETERLHDHARGHTFASSPKAALRQSHVVYERLCLARSVKRN